MTKGFTKFLFAMGLVFFQAVAVHIGQAGEYRQHEAHEHGVAHLNVAVQGSDLAIELFSPAANIVGFEHHPQTPAQKDRVKEARNKLGAAQTLFQLPAQAQGRLVKSRVDTDIDGDSAGDAEAAHTQGQTGIHDEDEKNGHEHLAHEHGHERHSDFKASYHFFFKNPEKLAYLDVMLMRIFPGIERIEVQILTDTGQTARELTAKDYRITF